MSPKAKKIIAENQIIKGDCLQVMNRMPDNIIDLIVTDPPYALTTPNGSLHSQKSNSLFCRTQKRGFMGKEWDSVVPSVEIWQACLRVLKPGAFAFVMCASRQDSLAKMILNLRQAGFNIDFTSIYWTYAAGFPKASNIGKLVHKRFKESVEENKTEKIIPQVISPEPSNDTAEQQEYIVNQRVQTAAEALDGSYAGFQPKPAVEVILVAMKPLSERTYADQAIKNKKGITWLDDCRIPYESEADKKNWRIRDGIRSNNPNSDLPSALANINKGRFPANLLVNDKTLNIASKGTTSRAKIKQEELESLDEKKFQSFSRYFDLDKWFHEQIKKLPKRVQKTFPFIIVSKASKREKNRGLENSPKRDAYNFGYKGNLERKLSKRLQPRANYHPTVKPIKLMSYLITLGSRPRDILLDPFAGSGTTCIAAQMMRRKYIGIEKEDEYVEIAKKRVESNKNLIY